jgi:hypothetical protein
MCFSCMGLEAGSNSRFFCSVECQQVFASTAHKWRHGACESCHRLLSRYASQCRGAFCCSRKCQSDLRKNKPLPWLSGHGQFAKEQTPWNKGLSKETSEGIARAAAAKVGDANPMKRESARKKSSASHAGKILPFETRKAMSDAANKVVAEGRHNFYKDGKGYERNIARDQHRNTFEYRLWRTAVFQRDGYQCQRCPAPKGSYLEAHHIKSWAEFRELRYDITNGLTLCRECHLQTRRKAA